jgi:hypothetical protein
LAGETEVLGENQPQCRFVHHKPICCPDANPGQRGRRIFEPKSDEIIGGCKKRRIEEDHNLYFSPYEMTIIKSRRIIWAGRVACVGEKTKWIHGFGGNPEGKRPVGRPRPRWGV